jgi:hypothetical protein
MDGFCLGPVFFMSLYVMPSFRPTSKEKATHRLVMQSAAIRCQMAGAVRSLFEEKSKKCIFCVTHTELSGIPYVSTGHYMPKIDFHGV